MSVFALVPAAGGGALLGAASPVAFIRLGGEPLVLRAARMLSEVAAIDHAWVSVAEADVPAARDLLAPFSSRVSVLPSASTEDWADTGSGVLLVHDLTHPLTAAAQVASVLAEVGPDAPVVAPVVAVSDTIKRVDPDGAVSGTEDRALLRGVQSPLGFAGPMPRLVSRVRDACRGGSAGPVALLRELDGFAGSVRTVPGSPLAFGLHTQWDLELAELLART